MQGLKVLFSSAAVAAALSSGTGETRQLSLVQSCSNDLDQDGKSPVKRVVELLFKMKSELEAETDKESEMYDKMVCWCETNEKEKTQAIADAEATEKELQAEIEERSAGSGKVSTNIAFLKKQIAEDTASLEQSRSIRENEATEARAGEKDLVQAITNLKNAVEVLGRHQSLAQLDAPLLSGLKVVLRDVAEKHDMMIADKHAGTAFVALGSKRSSDNTVSGEKLLKMLASKGAIAEQTLPLNLAESLLTRESKKEKGGNFLQQPLSASYSTRSDGIYGILTQMLEEFESQLSTEQKE